MKWKTCLLLALATATASFTSQADVINFNFNDTFGSGSTINSTTPAAATATSTAYQMISAKSFVPNPPTVSSGDLKFGIGSSSSGVFEVEALFATNPVVLVQPGDYIQLTIVFTNSSGFMAPPGPGASQLGIGLYNSGGAGPLPGGTNATPGLLPGYAQNWLGYAGQIVSGKSRIMTRPAQSGSTGSYQDVCLSGSSSSTYQGQVTVGTVVATAVSLETNAPYTEVFYITLNAVGSLAITNTLYAGPDTNGTVLVTSGGIATDTTFLTGGFDALALGYQSKAAGNPSLFDVSSISVTGTVTTVSAPPTITQQPVAVTVATNGSCVFNVGAMGYNMTYQWNRNGTNLVDDGNISGSTSSQLVINHAGTADAASGANGYYVTVTGVGNYNTNSTTNSLTLVPAQNLTWNGGSGVWDLNTSANWLTNGQPAYFNYGDNITFDDTTSLTTVNLNGDFLSASSVTVNAAYATIYTFQGTGSFAGSGSLNDIGPEELVLNNANTYSGGTLISNAQAYVVLKNYAGMGTGPVTLAKAGGILETTTTGSSSTGIAGDVNILDDFKIQVDGSGTYATVFLGNFSGTANKTLTLAPADISTTNRYRAYGDNTVCDANIAINPAGNSTSQAQYDGTVFAPYGKGTQIYNGVISGYGGIIQRGGTTILNGVNTYSGGTTPTTGSIGLGNNSALGSGPLVLAPEVPSTSGSGTIFASGGARTIATTLLYPSGTNNLTLIVGGTNDITFTSAIDLNGADGQGNPGNRTMQIDNTGATTLSGVISDNSANSIGFTKTGSGVLYLNGANTYGGSTTNSAGTLAGSGSLTGPVVVKSGASIGGGSSSAMGTLTIGGGLTIESGGGGYFRLNKGNSQTADKVSVAGILSSSGTGTVTVTNLGATLNVGDSFTLFNKAVTGGSTLAVVGGGVSWTNKLAVDGTIQVVSGVATNPTNIVFSAAGGTLSLSWPSDHTGWTLQVQTNSLANGLQSGNSSWVTVPGSTSTNAMDFPIDPANGSVFYRLIYQP